MTSFHHPSSKCGAKDNPEQKEVKEFAKNIERLYPREPIREFQWPVYYQWQKKINKEIWRRNEMCRAYPFINTTRYLREHFRCPCCISKIKLLIQHPDKEKLRQGTKFCEKCFAKNVKIEGFDFKINFLVNVIDDANFGKILYKRTTKPMVKKALGNIQSEEKRVIRRIGEIEETLTQICEIFRYIILFGRSKYPSTFSTFIYDLLNWRDTYCELWQNLKKYLDNIPEIKSKYQQLADAQSRADVCTGCFKSKDELTSPLRHTKKGMICKDCHEFSQREKQKEIMYKITIECPICNDTFRQFDTSQMIMAGCGNHYFCTSCADHWRSSAMERTGMKATCPMCRGEF